MNSKTEIRPGKQIRVAVTEDDRATREGLSMLINGTAGFRCVGAYRSVEDAVRSVDRDAPEVMLLDIELPGLSGAEGVKALKHTRAAMEILEKIEEQLTPQEVRLLKLLSDGYSYRGAAERLNISLNTVRNYIRSIYEKLHVHSMSAAVTRALRSRII